MNTVTFFEVLCAVLVVGVRCEWGDVQEECVKELHLDKAYIRSLNEVDHVPEDNAAFNKYLDCDWKKDGSVKANGKINWDKIDDVILEELQSGVGDNPKGEEVVSALFIIRIVQECREECGEDTIPAKLQNCLYKKVKLAFE